MQNPPDLPTSKAAGLYGGGLKRALDVLVAGTLLLLLAPAVLLLALLVRIFMGSPFLFRQDRAGFKGKPFTMYKFRTMTSERGADGELLPDEARVSRFGGLLRSTSLDELPELLNVLLGDMSLVGPRPFLLQYLPRYTPTQARRMDVRPGITGWAQINGRNLLMFSKRIEFDVWYVDHLSFLLDLRILLLTVPRALTARGVHVTETEDMVDLDP